MKKLLIASGLAVVSLAAATTAEAACRQQFSHTTCLPFWQGGTCTNHFKQVCDAPVAKIAVPPPQNRVTVQPNVNAGRLIGNDGSTLISNNRGGVIARDGAGLISNNRGGLISENGLGARGR